MNARLIALAATLLALMLAGCSGDGSPVSGDVVVTLIPAGVVSDQANGATGWPYPEGSRLVWLPQADSRPRELSTGLVAAGAPDVAPDGRRVLFAGRATSDGAVQAIYEIAPGERAPRRVYAGEQNCGEPAHLAHGAIVFTCETAGADALSTVRALFVLEPGDARPERITWAPVDSLDPTPLRDGRILFAMPRAVSTDALEVALYTVNADGSLPEPFGDVHAAGAVWRRPRQDANGDVIVVSTTSPKPASGVARIPFTRPSAADRLELPGDLGGEGILGVEPDGDALLIVTNGGRGGVFRMAQDGTTEALAVSSGDFVPIEAVPLRPSPALRGRPRIVDEKVDTGFLVGYDAGRSDGIVGPPQGSPAPHAVRLQMQRAGRARFLTAGTGASAVDRVGSVSLHGDRSFFFEVPADVPLRVTTVDAGGRTIATSSWFWVRPGETRACFGCHAGHAVAPINRPVAAIQAPPVRLLDLAETIVARTESAAPTEAGQ